MYFLHTIGQSRNLIGSAQSQCHSFIIMPARPAYSMQINVYINVVLLVWFLRSARIYNKRCISNINTPSHNVRTHQNVGFRMLKFLYDLFFFRVRQVYFLTILVSFCCYTGFRQILQVLSLLACEITRKGVEDFIELVNIIDRIKEDKHLSLLVILNLTVKLPEDFLEDIIINLHFGVLLALYNMSIVFDSF